jgi:hypothetical protein
MPLTSSSRSESIGEGQGRLVAPPFGIEASCRWAPTIVSAVSTAARAGSASPAQPSAPIPTTAITDMPPPRRSAPRPAVRWRPARAR